MKKYAQLLVFAILIACSGHKETRQEINIPTIKINVEDIAGFDLEDIAEFEKMIALETAEENLIGRIERVFLQDSILIVWDSKMNSLPVFNTEGEYLYNIGEKGSGPEEYIHISDVYVYDSEPLVKILDDAGRRILTFGIDGVFKDSQQLDYYLYTFLPEKDGTWGTNAYQNDKKYDLIYLNGKTKEMECGFFPSDETRFLIKTNNFLINGDKTYYHFSYSDSIYIIQNKDVIPFLAIDFGEKKGQGINMKNYEKLEYTGQIHNVHMYGDHLFFTFFRKKGGMGEKYPLDVYYACVSLKNMKPRIYTQNTIKHSEEATVSPFPDIVNVSREKLIYQIVPETFDDDKIIELLKQSPGLEKSRYKADIKNDSNPILLIYSLKPNS